MKKIKVSVVSYLNSKPFIYGLQHSDIINDIDLSLDIPSVCAQKLIEGGVDIGLIPVSVIPLLKEHHIISDFCIAACGKVTSVMLYSEVPLQDIKTVLLDYQSRTSITLVKILADRLWKINPEWVPAKINYENLIGEDTAGVVIGDRTFELKNKYKYSYDLAEEWQKLTQLPFVFACWVSNKKLPDTFINGFNKALQKGLENRHALAKELQHQYQTDIEAYFRYHINYIYDAPKKQALKLFLEYSSIPV